MFGPAVCPPAGQAVVAVALKRGAFPPRLAAGDRVSVWPGPSEVGGTANTASALSAGAVVSAVNGSDSQGTTVVTLLADAQSAARIAQAPSVSMVEIQPATVGGS